MICVVCLVGEWLRVRGRVQVRGRRGVLGREVGKEMPDGGSGC